MSVGDKMKHEKVYQYFKEISAIPRCSGAEGPISEYLKDTARALGLEVESDHALNVLIRKPASPGYEDHEPVALQGHMDMVCVKNEGVCHDFEKDPIRLIQEGSILRADGTTLGADNGIFVAMGLSLMADRDLKHPPLEMLVTTAEETSMVGANSVSSEWLKARRMINIDTEEEGFLIIGCAGGMDLHCTRKVTAEQVDGYFYTVELSGFPGGHSGMEIDKDIPNANKVLAEKLAVLYQKQAFRLTFFEGGDKHNAIPSSAKAGLVFETPWDSDGFVSDHWPECAEVAVREGKKSSAIGVTDTREILALIHELPHGPQGFMPGKYSHIVETSDNLAIVKVNENEAQFLLSVRSSQRDELEKLAQSIERIAHNHQATVERASAYQPWEYKEDSPMQKILTKVYENMYGKAMTVTVIHAGLECAIFEEKYPGMDAVSVGPDMWDVHTPKERVDLDSVDRCYDYLVNVLENL